jgi:hypothetical protein
MLTHRLFVLVAIFLANLVYAQTPYVPPGLSKAEMQVLELHGLNDAALNNTWNRLGPYSVAAEALRRSALLARCTKITSAKPDDYYFDPALRTALNGVVDKMRAGKLLPSDLQGFRYRSRTQLWAARHTSAADWLAVSQLAQTPAGQLALRRMRAAQVMDNFETAAMDTSTGAWLAYPVIALKAYFTQSGQIEAFDRALRAVEPRLAADFVRVRTLEQTTAADLGWLGGLSNALADKMPNISKAFFELLPAGERKTLNALDETIYFRLYNDASDAIATPMRSEPSLDDPKFRGLAPGKRGQPHYAAFVRASVNSEFPPSVDEIQRLGRMSPQQVADSVHLAFCP